MIIAMMWVNSGGRYDDRPWPPAGVEFEVPDWEGEGLVRAKQAVFIRDSAPPPAPVPAPPPAPVQAEAAAEAEIRAEVAFPAEAGAEEETGGTPTADADVPVPAPSDPKAGWIAYAVSQGADADAAARMSKADLMSRYGGRL